MESKCSLDWKSRICKLIPLSARICPNWTSAFEAYLGGSRDKYGRIWWADGNNTNLASTYIIDIIENMLFYSVC